jgi:hypothetical protein
MPATWECPSCKRRVPLSIEECRCGWLRSRVAVAPPRPTDAARGATTRRPWELWAVVAVMVVCIGRHPGLRRSHAGPEAHAQDETETASAAAVTAVARTWEDSAT